MLFHLIDDSRKPELQEILRLLHIFETPLIWDGKTESELTNKTDLSKVEFNFSNAQEVYWQNLTQAYAFQESGRALLSMSSGAAIGLISSALAFRGVSKDSAPVEETAFRHRVDSWFLEALQDTPLIHQNDMARRVGVAQQILDRILEKSKNGSEHPCAFEGIFKPLNPSEPQKQSARESKKNAEQSRLIIFESMRISFDNNGLSDPKRALLQSVGLFYKIDNESFNELLSQAAALNKELRRSINLVLE